MVAGGSVVTRQPLLAWALEAQLRLVDAELELRVLAEEPVAGAVVLARRLTDPGPITGLYRAFSDLGELERHVVDSSGQTPEQTAAELAAALDGGQFAC